MTRDGGKNFLPSLSQRLYNLARERGETVDQVLTRFALERFLYRLSRSEFHDRFLLKGALLFRLWHDRPHCPTRGVDFLCSGGQDLAEMEEVFRIICQVPAEDGLVFPPRTVKASEIREANDYHGVRVVFMAEIGGARIPLQADIGFGDAVAPEPESIEYPSLLGLPAPWLRVYPKYSVISEKFQAAVALGMQHSRMKDFYDLWVLSREFEFDGAQLAQAIRATFERRRTDLPEEIPLAFTNEFARNPAKQGLWIAFIRRSQLEENAPGLADAVLELENFLMPPVAALLRRESFSRRWPPGGPWLEQISGEG